MGRIHVPAAGVETIGIQIPVYVLKEVSQADLVLLLCSVGPHIQAGFGGGNKLLFPGCAHGKTIGLLHQLGLNGSIEGLIGQELGCNPMRQTIERAAALLGPKVFCVGTVLDWQGRVTHLSAGQPQAVHQHLAELCRKTFELPVVQQADVVVASAFPRDYDLLQGLKCLANTRMAARKGGVLIGTLNFREAGHLTIKSKLGVAPTAWLIRLLTGILGVKSVCRFAELASAGLDNEARFFLRLALETINRNRVLLYCPRLDVKNAGLPCVEMYNDVGALWQRAQKLLGRPRTVKVNVFTDGGISYPRIRPARLASGVKLQPQE